MLEERIVIIGAGIAGLTSAALLAKAGQDVVVCESHYQSGGCAGTFKRGKYIFDVGATQVAGLENGGIHQRIFNYLSSPIPECSLLDPVCIVDLDDGLDPIYIWHDQKKWEQERIKQFPNSKKFWDLCSNIHQTNWQFYLRDPVLPVRNLWDLGNCLNALGPRNLLFGLFIKSSVLDLLRFSNCANDTRLQKFLDIQLKLYSQENCKNTAALYGATVLQMGQSPHGLWHLQGSMQELSNQLQQVIYKYGGKILFNNKVEKLIFNRVNNQWDIHLKASNENHYELKAQDLIFTPPPQSLKNLLEVNNKIVRNYLKSIDDLNQPSGAIVFYGAINREKIVNLNSSHYQILSDTYNSIFISISQEGDGRAPFGEATIIASIFTSVIDWFDLDKDNYLIQKQKTLNSITNILSDYFGLLTIDWNHRELATPRGFQRWTNRPMGIVGGLGQSPDLFGPFGLSTRTDVHGLWLCGDSIHPGEGTAGVSQSAYMMSRQILKSRGINLNI
tara:strand:+ start:213 stop:1718 length:1506 start_codon:yes stop_codon:yes gene_type:complete